MSEAQKAGSGYKSQFHLHNGTALYKLRHTKEFDVPGATAREQEETTHLESEDWRREYESTFYEDADIEVLLNSRPLSDTDVLLEDALKDGDVRAFKAVIAISGVLVAQIPGTCRCTGYNRGRVTPGGVMEATATFRLVTVDPIAPYSA